MNVVTQRYLAACSDHDSGLRHAARDLALPEVYRTSYGGLQLDRPMLAPESEITGFGASLVDLFDLLVSLPARVSGGDLRGYCARLGMDDRLADLACRGDRHDLPVYARADAYHDGNGFQLLELNVGSELGGIDTAQVNRAFLQVPAFADFAERHDLRHLDTLPRTARALRTAAREVTSGEPVIALIESNGGLAAHQHVFVAIQEAMAGLGIVLLLGELDELGERAGKVTLRGTPVDVILRYFVAGELVDDPAGQRVLDLVLRARDTVLFAPLSAAAFASKGSLAMLHEPDVAGTLSAGERALVDRIVPWTRLLAGADPELVERCRDEREELVLKPGIGYGGVGTVVGHEVSDEEWHHALAERTTGDHVVQRRVRPATESVMDADTGAIDEWVANWGIFVDADGYAGGFVRALRPEHGAVVSYSNKGTRGTCVFTAP
ncbi:hypothetical protein BLA60_02795 [Actinophytocola xinjiangensis]|uniref:Circularly permuted ATP-grasp superfamily protein n=1 Tax=Actinophytocola xinjiangensis TaxID=485602 RepID=A0A7Z1B1L9_9PSEU|nr:hypothetical protein BLA60_02795 [Actinophytocola xinjiangensis]